MAAIGLKGGVQVATNGFTPDMIATALGILAACSSYIAVPAAMRLALPQADSGLYLAMSLGVTFPFNITVSISLYTFIATQVFAP